MSNLNRVLSKQSLPTTTKKTKDKRKVSCSHIGEGSPSAMAKVPIALFRSLLRARRLCFAGDDRMLRESRRQIRAVFDENRQVLDPARLDQLFLEGQEAIHVFTNSIIQAKLNERGNLEIKPTMEHAGATLEMPSPERKRCS